LEHDLWHALRKSKNPARKHLTLEKAVEPQISQINTDYQGIAEFKALTQRASFS
jgi:hypothetical protein